MKKNVTIRYYEEVVPQGGALRVTELDHNTTVSVLVAQPIGPDTLFKFITTTTYA